MKIVYVYRAGAQASKERNGLTLVEMWHTWLQSDSNAQSLGVTFDTVRYGGLERKRRVPIGRPLRLNATVSETLLATDVSI